MYLSMVIKGHQSAIPNASQSSPMWPFSPKTQSRYQQAIHGLAISNDGQALACGGKPEF